MLFAIHLFKNVQYFLNICFLLKLYLLHLILYRIYIILYYFEANLIFSSYLSVKILNTQRKIESIV